MGDCTTYRWVLCGGSDFHPIPWIWTHHNHIVSKDKMITYLVPIVNPQCICLDIAKMLAMIVGKRAGVSRFPTNICVIFRYLCKVDYATDKFIHAPAFNYNEVMHLFDLAGMAEKAKSGDSEGHENIAFIYIYIYIYIYVCPKKSHAH
jgi:hypothetical protein